MTKRTFTVPSSDGIHTLSGVIFEPEEMPKGAFHIVHGMTEHIGRYERLMTDLTKEGYLCFGFDNLGHGNTARDKSELGFIAEKNGHLLLAEDVKRFSDAVRKEYTSEGAPLPYYLMGHSMGSFITRLAVTSTVKPNGYIIMGTGGKNPAVRAGLVLIRFLKLLRGKRHVSPFINKMAFGSYNKRFGGGSDEDPSPWLTRDENARKQYYKDPFCSFKFTLSAMEDLLSLIQLTNREEWFQELPENLPILLLSGEEDPVGDYGKGVKEVASLLQKAGLDTKCVLYHEARHEILNDSCYPQVKDEILSFLKRRA